MPENAAQTLVEYEVRGREGSAMFRHFVSNLVELRSILEKVSPTSVIGVYKIYKSLDGQIIKSDTLRWSLNGENLSLRTVKEKRRG